MSTIGHRSGQMQNLQLREKHLGAIHYVLIEARRKQIFHVQLDRPQLFWVVQLGQELGNVTGSKSVIHFAIYVGRAYNSS
jgi:hypothetical protein